MGAHGHAHPSFGSHAPILLPVQNEGWACHHKKDVHVLILLLVMNTHPSSLVKSLCHTPEGWARYQKKDGIRAHPSFGIRYM